MRVGILRISSALRTLGYIIVITLAVCGFVLMVGLVFL